MKIFMRIMMFSVMAVWIAADAFGQIVVQDIAVGSSNYRSEGGLPYITAIIVNNGNEAVKNS
ncbi:hypothetical protein ACFL30_03355, partial [Candidatus Latescibacterota bacterium]